LPFFGGITAKVFFLERKNQRTFAFQIAAPLDIRYVGAAMIVAGECEVAGGVVAGEQQVRNG
jgi:hypothetical protein